MTMPLKKTTGIKRPKKNMKQKKFTRGRKKYYYYLITFYLSPFYVLPFLLLDFHPWRYSLSPLSPFRTCFLLSTKNRFDSIRFLRGRTHTHTHTTD